MFPDKCLWFQQPALCVLAISHPSAFYHGTKF
jgi:hypothetical protein